MLCLHFLPVNKKRQGYLTNFLSVLLGLARVAAVTMVAIAVITLFGGRFDAVAAVGRRLAGAR